MGDGVNLANPTAYARFSIRGVDKSVLEGWKLSYADISLRDPANPGQGFARIDCAGTIFVVGKCTAWRIHKESGLPLAHPVPTDQNRAALVGGGIQEKPDAGEWILPFAFAVCLKDVFEDIYGDPVAAVAACRILAN